MNLKIFFEKIPLWIKMGVISVILASIIFSIDRYSFFFSSLDFLSVIWCSGVCTGWNSLIQIITVWPSFFIIGSLIGVILSKYKIKSKIKIAIITVITFIILFGVSIIFNYDNYLMNDMDSGMNIKFNNVYYYTSGKWGSTESLVKINNADYKTIKYIQGYMVDNNNVFYVGPFRKDSYIILSKDVENFEILNNMYTKDKENVYVFGQIIIGADPVTFEVINQTEILSDGSKIENTIRAKDKNYYYVSGRIESEILN
jgi:hypothetical protein